MEKIKLFGRRKGRKIRKAKTSLLERFLPKIAISENVVINSEIFTNPVEKMCLEIGFGGGEHLAGVSLIYPNKGYVGAEVFQNGIANLLSLMTGIKQSSQVPENITFLSARSDNVRVFADDVRKLFLQTPDNTFDEIFLLFPDPWPKNRHADRRFVNQQNIKELARILKKGGRLLIATDHQVYKKWVLQQFRNNEFFYWTAKKSDDWRNPPQDWVETKYQKKAIREGRRPVFFDFCRK